MGAPRGGPKHKRPKVEIEIDEALILALRLSKCGYGRPDEILAMQTEIVLAAAEYENFLGEYEAEFLRLNTEKK